MTSAIGYYGSPTSEVLERQQYTSWGLQAGAMAMAMASLLVAATGYTVMAAAPVVLYAAPAVHAKVAQQLGNSIVVHRSRLPLHFVPTDVEHADPEPAATPDVTQQQLGIRQSAQVSGAHHRTLSFLWLITACTKTGT